jgi:hypothetical protein
LIDFMQAWLPDGYPTDLQGHLALTDNVVLAAMEQAARDPSARGHDPARRFMQRDHFRLLAEVQPDEIAKNPEAGQAIVDALRSEFPEQAELIQLDALKPKAARREPMEEGNVSNDFPLLLRDERVVPAAPHSPILATPPANTFNYILVDKKLKDRAAVWLKSHRDHIIQPQGE